MYLSLKTFIAFICIFDLGNFANNSNIITYTYSEKQTYNVQCPNVNDEIDKAIQDLYGLNFSIQWSTNRIIALTTDKKHRKDYNLLDKWMTNYWALHNLYLNYKLYNKQLREILQCRLKTKTLAKNEIILFSFKLLILDTLEDNIAESFTLYENTLINYKNKP
jgi:hypothetical protein